MNIESANLSSLVSSSVTVESMLPPVVDAGVISEGFSDALVTQIQLLSNVATEDLLPLQVTDIAGLQTITDQQATTDLSVSKADMQDFAALLGNDLPSSYKTKDEVDHEAALALVTDTLKYIAMGTTAGEKAAEAEQNIKDVIAMAVVPAEQNMEDTIAVAVPAEQNMEDTIAVAVPAEQNMKDVTAMAIPAEQIIKDTIAVVAPVEQSATDVVAETDQGMKDAGTPVQMDLEQAKDNDKVDKKQGESEAPLANVEDSHGAEELVATITFTPVMPIEQGKSVNNWVPADVIEEGALLSFIKPSTGDAKSNQPAKAPDNVLHSETVFRQPVQDKQGFNLKYFDNAGQAEKPGRIEQQVLGLEGEKTLPRIGTDITVLNRSIVENKTDVPAITKPLSHPEWNKDLGERIVWMSSKAIPSAEIRLNPEHLGPISVRVNVADDQATVVFTAQHAATREALEASIPKLREMMGAQQLNLVDVNVSQSAASDQGRSQAQNFAQTADGRGQQGAGGAAGDGVDDVEQEIESGRAVVSKGLLSLYA
jgi:flagellar hook-length control protein FliK